VLGGALATPFLRARRLSWGATDEELECSIPGDNLIPAPRWMATHAITIRASAERIWPWIAQLGQGRGGFYSYQRLENLAGCRIENADRVLSEHQAIAVGDHVKLHVEGPPMVVALVERPHSLVLHGNPADAEGGPEIETTWALHVIERSDGTSRLLSRTRYRHGQGLAAKLMGGPLLLEPVSFVMERKMLKVLKSLIESGPSISRR